MRSSTLLSFAILSLLAASNAVAQSSGTFVATGSTTFPRANHTVTPVNDGRVLIDSCGRGPVDATFKVDGLEFRNSTREASARQGAV